MATAAPSRHGGPFIPITTTPSYSGFVNVCRRNIHPARIQNIQTKEEEIEEEEKDEEEEEEVCVCVWGGGGGGGSKRKSMGQQLLKSLAW